MPSSNSSVQPGWIKESAAKAERDLVAKYGETQRSRAHKGVEQVSEFWRAEDGDANAFDQFIAINFAGNQATLDTMFNPGTNT